jgi:hypothetical protein
MEPMTPDTLPRPTVTMTQRKLDIETRIGRPFSTALTPVVSIV